VLEGLAEVVRGAADVRQEITELQTQAQAAEEQVQARLAEQHLLADQAGRALSLFRIPTRLILQHRLPAHQP
jgi:hypothetical protein